MCPRDEQPYQPEEDFTLLQAASTVGNDWNQANTLHFAYNNFLIRQLKQQDGSNFPNRSIQSLRKRWDEVVNPDLPRNQWSEESLNRLTQLYNTYQNHQYKWRMICINLGISKLPMDVIRECVRLGLCDESELQH